MEGQDLGERMQRQVLVNLGNRHVLFGPKGALPGQYRFTPADIPRPLPRAGDESDLAELQIIETLRVSDAEVVRSRARSSKADGVWDLETVDPAGCRTLIEIKTLERDPKRQDLERFCKSLQEHAGSPVSSLEIWNFNIERPRLRIFGLDDREFLQCTELVPLDVWQYDRDGRPVLRSTIVEAVEDWAQRIDRLYMTVEEWVGRIGGLHVQRTRMITMDEERMQTFAVPARELPLLDIQRAGEPIITFLPFALWILGGNGRIDVITSAGTRLLIDQGPKGTPDWTLVDAWDRKQRAPFDEAAFAVLVQAADLVNSS